MSTNNNENSNPNKKFKTITLIGSVKFENDFKETAKRLTKEGNLVLMPVYFGGYDQIDILLEMSYQRIRMSDEIIVIDKDGYIGEHTQKEIDYAKELGRRIVMLSALKDIELAKNLVKDVTKNDKIISLVPSSIDEKEAFYRLISNNYKKEFYGYKDPEVPTRDEIIDSKCQIYSIVITDQVYPHNPVKYVIGYIQISDRAFITEKYLDVALYPHFVGLNVMKLVLPLLNSLCISMHVNELYSWTFNEKVKESLEKLGFAWQTDDYWEHELNINKSLYMYQVIKHHLDNIE